MSEIDHRAIWRALPQPALVIGEQGAIIAANEAAEAFFSLSAAHLIKRRLDDLVGKDSRLGDLVGLARDAALSAADNEFELRRPGQPPVEVDAQAARLDREGGVAVLLTLQPRGLARQIDRTLTHRAAARSVTGLAAMLAHEIRNPLAGISGAAQLLEMSLPEEDHELTALIQDEARRIGDMVARMDAFGEAAPAAAEPVNIHDVLDRARLSAEAGWGAQMRFRSEFDPSLPPVPGDSDRLVQLFQNLFRNATEAAGPDGGSILIRTAYRPGVALAAPDGRREGAPIVVEVRDDGPGVPDSIRAQMFEPFVSSKPGGGGLGLALVSKLVADHGGTIDCESEPGRTVMRLRFPKWREGTDG